MSPILQLHDDGGFYVAVGDLVAGKYRVERVLGSGGMAFVLSARHVELDEHFALKFLDERFLGNAVIAERFTQEARAACKIRSEHVARVYDVGIHEGAPFFVMEHLEGRDLCAVVSDIGPMAVRDAVECIMQACEALAVAHCLGIVHRDIKPENLFLVERAGVPLIKVLDFGISKVALTGGAPVSRLTGDLTLGTPCYMSPEQIRSTASADARSDQWSLGVVLYELLTGVEAFRAGSVNAVCAAVLEREPQALVELRPDLPYGLADIVMRCLEKNPANRFADVAELATALLPFAPTRALVSAERSSSVMRGARRGAVRERRVSSVRPITSSSSHPSSDAGPPSSTSPVARLLEPSPRGAPEHGLRRRSGAFAVAAISAIAIAGFGIGGIVSTSAVRRPPSVAAAARLQAPRPIAKAEEAYAEPAIASAPTAKRPTMTDAEGKGERAPSETVRAVTPSPGPKRAASPGEMPASSLRSAAPAHAAASPSSEPSTPADATRAKRSVSAAEAAAPVSIELGY